MTVLSFEVFAKDRASNTFDKVGRSVDHTGSKLQKLSKLGKVAGLGLAAGVGLAGKSLFDMTKAAIADEAAQKKLAVALKNNAGATKGQVASVESWISAQGKALGVTDDELRPALGRLVTATHSVGKAQKLTALAMDVSAGSGKSLESVTAALVKAQNGNVGGLSRLGVATKDAEGKTKSLRAITAELAKTYQGQASAAANTTEGKFRRLKVQFDEAKEAIGAKLIPVASRLADFLVNKLGPGVARVGAWLSKNLGPAFAAAGGFITGRLVPAARQLWSWFVEKIAPGIQRAVMPVLAGVRDAFSKVRDKLEENRPSLEKLGLAFRNVAEFVANKVAPVVGKVLGGAFKVAGRVMGVLIDATFRCVDALSHLGPAFRTIGRVVQVVGRVGRTAFGWVADKIGDVIAVVRGAATKAFRVYATGVKVYLKGVTTALRWVVDRVGDVISIVRGPATKVFRVYSTGVKAYLHVVTTAVGGVVSAVSKLIGWIKGPASAAWRAYRSVASTVIGAVVDAVGRIVTKVGAVVTAVRGAFTSVWNGAKTAAVNALNAIKSPLSWLIDKVQSLLNLISRIKLPSGGKIGGLISKIPGLATGGTVTRAGLTWVGEQGPELLTLPRGATVTPLARALASSPALAAQVHATQSSRDRAPIPLPRVAPAATTTVVEKHYHQTFGDVYTANPKEFVREAENRQRQMIAMVR